MTAGPDHGGFRAVSAWSTSAIPGLSSEPVVKYKGGAGFGAAAPAGQACSGVTLAAEPLEGPAAGTRRGRSRVGRSELRAAAVSSPSRARARARGCIRARTGVFGARLGLSACDCYDPRQEAGAPNAPCTVFSREFLGSFHRLFAVAQGPRNSRAACSKPLKRRGCLLQFRPSRPICPPQRATSFP